MEHSHHWANLDRKSQSSRVLEHTTNWPEGEDFGLSSSEKEEKVAYAEETHRITSYQKMKLIPSLHCHFLPNCMHMYPRTGLLKNIPALNRWIGLPWSTRPRWIWPGSIVENYFSLSEPMRPLILREEIQHPMSLWSRGGLNHGIHLPGYP